MAKRFDILRSHLLPDQFSPTGQYSDRELDLTRAYVLLVHAEMESYLEDRARQIAQRAQSMWQKSGRRSRVIKRLFHFHNRWERPWRPFENSPNAIQAALNSYASLIQNNHGIKEDSVLLLLFPIGIEYKHLDVVWLNNLTSFGKSRGFIAHNSIKAQQPPDPKSEYQKVKELTKGFKIIDRRISRLI